MESKPIWKSKTVWVNVLMAISGFLVLPDVQAAVGPDALKYIVLAQSAINIGLRFLTVGTMTFGGPPK